MSRRQSQAIAQCKETIKKNAHRRVALVAQRL